MKTVLVHDRAIAQPAERALPQSAPAVALRDVRKVHGQGDAAVVALDGISVELVAGVVHRDHGAVGVGQEHVPARCGRAGPAYLRHRRARGHRAGEAQRAAADDPQARADRVRLPGVQPDAVAHGHPEHRPAAALGRSPRAALGGARSRRAGRAGQTPRATVPPSSPAVSSSGSRSPARSSPGPRWYSPTNRPERLTPDRAWRARAPTRGRGRGWPHRRDGHP